MSAVPEHVGDLSSGDEAPDWDAVAELWEGLPPQTLWRRHSDRVNSALARAWIPRADLLLKTDLWDEATGEGLYPELAQRADEVLGIDVSEHILAAATRRYPALRAVRAEVRALPLADGSVDAIVSNSTLDHFERRSEIDESVQELARVLRPGGTLLLTLDNPLNPFVALSKALPHRALNRAWLRLGALSARVGVLPYHVGTTYGPAELRRLLDRSGFTIEAETTLVHSPRILAVMVGHLIEHRVGETGQERFLRVLAAAERLGGLPTRYVTGHFHGVRATRR